ncbi:MAG: hypothetical protein Kow00123_18430 [Anaerolineales bacterium]
MFRVGRTIKQLQETRNTWGGDEAACWPRVCADILRGLPSRPHRGFLPQSPLFQDMLLSLLNVAEWLLEPNPQQAIRFIRDCQQQPDEEITVSQIALSSALFGWVQGYSKVGNFVADRGWRTILAEQAMATAVAGHSVDTNVSDSAAFYATREGTRTALRRFLQPVEISHSEMRHETLSWDQASHKWKSGIRIQEVHESVEYQICASCRIRWEPR